MSKKPTYWELLKHPKWQEKRLRIMERAGFRCEYCDSEDKTLNVHHSYYERGCDPWEYPDETLHCLCEKCHERADGLRKELQRIIGQIGIGDSLEEMIGFAQGMLLERNLAREMPARTYSCIDGMVRVFLTLSGHQRGPIITDIIAGFSEKPDNAERMIADVDLLNACDCDRLAAEAKERNKKRGIE